MIVLPYLQIMPTIHTTNYIAPTAALIGDVTIEQDVTIWFNTTIRGDLAPIFIGRGTNIQENVVIHVDKEVPTSIGEYVTVGHSAVVHGCNVENGALIGIGATLLDNCTIGEYSLVAAGSLVPPNKKFPPRSLIMGSPAKVVRELSDQEILGLKENAETYIALGHSYNSEVAK